MRNHKNTYAVVFMAVVWVAILASVALRCYSSITGPDGLGAIHFKTVDEMLDGNN